MDKLVIDNITGRVENCIRVEKPTFSLKGKTLVEYTGQAHIGDTWDGTTFIKKSVPAVVLTKEQIRQEALAEKWPDPFSIIDDILVRGIDVVKAERIAIKEANPKE